MKWKAICLTVILSSLISLPVFSQLDELESQLLGEMDAVTDYAVSTFLSENIVVGKSTVLHERGNLSIRFRHHFNPLSGGVSEAFGFNRASVYTAINYAPEDWLNLELGYGSHDGSFNGNAKFRLLRQSTGKVVMPVNFTLFGAINYRTSDTGNAEVDADRAGRINYTLQGLTSRRFSNFLSLQLSPSLVHRNLTATPLDPNNIYALGAGSSFKLLKNMRFNMEYYYLLNGRSYDPVSVGVSYQTSRHNFELFLTNTQFIKDNYFITDTSGSFFEGDVRVGFNIAINFTLGKSNH
jgi:hypothetical protein